MGAPSKADETKHQYQAPIIQIIQYFPLTINKKIDASIITEYALTLQQHDYFPSEIIKDAIQESKRVTKYRVWQPDTPNIVKCQSTLGARTFMLPEPQGNEALA